MTIDAHVSKLLLRQAFEDALALPLRRRANMFVDLRAALRAALTRAIVTAGQSVVDQAEDVRMTKAAITIPGTPLVIPSGDRRELQTLDASFCARYGLGDYSVQGINYINRAHSHLPSLSVFLDVDQFSAGNVAVRLAPGASNVRIVTESPLRAVGWLSEIGARKRKPYVAVLGVHFERRELISLLGDTAGMVKHAECHPDWLDEHQVGMNSYPALWICRYCGRLYSCDCFRDCVDVRDDLCGRLPYGNSEPELRARAEGVRFIPDLCHLCSGGVPRSDVGRGAYFTGFAGRYAGYIELFVRRAHGGRQTYSEDDWRTAENDVRKFFGYPAIGERWVSETMLYRVVERIVAPLDVVRHYRGKELEGLELDVWVPKLKLGIEYQGEQHYQSMSHWGGDEGFARRRANDARKRKLCRSLGYTLVEFRFDEPLTDITVERRLARYLPRNQAAVQ